MRPYYEQDGITIYQGDCRELLPELRADVAITDPPYGISLEGYSDDPGFVRDLIRGVMPVLLSRVNRALVFCGPAMLFAYPEPAAIGGVVTLGGVGRCAWGFQCIHPILFYGNDPFLADGRGGRPNAFRTDAANTERIDHPCPKPQSWLNWAITRASREGESILDPFMGSGTTLVAAKRFNRPAIGIELEERYCEIAAQRLAQGALDFSPSISKRDGRSDSA